MPKAPLDALLLDGLRTHYGFERVVVLSILNQNRDRLVVSIRASAGRFVVKVCQVRDEEGFLQTLSVFDFLAARGFEHCPTLQKTLDGSPGVKIGAAIAYVMEFIDGDPLGEAPEFTHALGRAVGRLHRLKDFARSTPFATRVIIPELRERAFNTAWSREYLSLVNALPDFERPPRGLIHADIHPAQCLLRRGGPLVIVDWDDAGIGPRVLDLGMPLIQAFVSEGGGAFKVEEARAFYAGYFSESAPDGLTAHDIFDAALFYALDYLIFGDPEVRWQRISWCLEHRALLESATGL